MSKHDDLYREAHGDPRNLPDGHPDRWQWEYQGRPEERRDLLDRLRDCAAASLETEDEQPQTEALF